MLYRKAPSLLMFRLFIVLPIIQRADLLQTALIKLYWRCRKMSMEMIHNMSPSMYLTVFCLVQSPSSISVPLQSHCKHWMCVCIFLIHPISGHMLKLQWIHELSAICQGFRDINNFWIVMLVLVEGLSALHIRGTSLGIWTLSWLLGTSSPVSFPATCCLSDVSSCNWETLLALGFKDLC